MPAKKKAKPKKENANLSKQKLTWNDLVSGVNFHDIFLIKSIYQRDLDELLTREDKKINVELKLNSKLIKLEKTKLIASVLINIDFNFKSQKEDEIVTISKCEVEYTLMYNRKDKIHFTDFENNIINDFVKRNVIHNTWPFAREHISNLLVKSGAPPFYLPSLVI